MKNKPFQFLWLGQTLANAGDIFYLVGLIPIIYGISESTIYIALLPFSTTLTRFFSALIAPILLDRFRLQRLLVYSQLGKTFVLLLLAGFSTFYLTSDTIFLIFIFTILIALLDGWATPARDALLPRIVPSNELVKVNSFITIVDRTIQLAGWPLGGIIIAFLGGKNLIWFTVLLYIISTLMMILIGNVKSNTSKMKKSSKRFEGLTEGWTTILKTPYLLIITIVEIIETNANVVWIAAIMYVYVTEILNTSEEWWGYINSIFFAGLLLGGILGIKWSHVIEKHLILLINIGAFLVSLIALMFGLISNAWIALILSFLYGFCSQLKGIAQVTFVQTNVAEQYLSKVYAAQDAANFGTFAISTLLFGFLTDIFNARFTFCLSAILLFTSALLLIINRKILISQNNKTIQLNQVQ